jgi:dihydroxyacetone kinase
VEVLEGQMGVRLERVFTGPFMTSLEMAGISVTILKARRRP